MTDSNATTPANDSSTHDVVHGMVAGSHERGAGPTCRCGAEWSRWSDACARQITADLIELAGKIDEARKAANAIEVVAGTNHAYGDLSGALKKVLKTITGNDAAADLLYSSIAFDGNTVAEAFSWFDKNK